MNRIVIIISLLWLSTSVTGQSCFDRWLDEGIEAYNSLQFEVSINKFNAAKICPAITSQQVSTIEEWIAKANQGYIDFITQAKEEAEQAKLDAEKARDQARKEAVRSEANRIAFIALQENEKNNSDDAMALAYHSLNLSEEPLPSALRAFGDAVYQKTVQFFLSNDSEINYCAFSYDGKRSILANRKGLIYLLDHESRDIQELRGVKHAPPIAHFTPSNDLIYFNENHQLVIRRHSDNQEIVSSNKHEQKVILARVSPDEKRVASIDQHRMLYIWDIQGNLIQKTELSSKVSQMVWDKRSQFLGIRTYSNQYFLFDRQSKQRSVIDQSNLITLGEMSTTQNHIAIANSAHQVMVYDFSGRLIKTLQSHTDFVSQIKYSSTGNHLFSASLDGMLHIYDDQYQPIASINNQKPINQFIVNGDGSRIIIVDQSNQINIWKADGQRIAIINQHDDPITFLGFSDNDQFFISGDQSGNIFLWNNEGLRLMTPSPVSSPVIFCRVGNGNRGIFAAYRNGTLWRSESPQNYFQELRQNEVDLLTEDLKLKYEITNN